jgi:hypothetical protein
MPAWMHQHLPGINFIAGREHLLFAISEALFYHGGCVAPKGRHQEKRLAKC